MCGTSTRRVAVEPGGTGVVALAALLRPGNAGANTVADHVAVLDAPIAQLPGEIWAGHHGGDDSDEAGRPLVPSSSGPTRPGGPRGSLAACRARNVGFYV